MNDKEEEEIGNLLEEMSASKKIIETSLGPLWLHFPTADDRMFARYVYNTTLEEQKELGAPSLDEAIEEHDKLGLWTKKSEEQMIKLPVFMKDTEIRIKQEKNKIRQKKYKQWLIQLQNMYLELTGAKAQLFLNTAEFMANNASLANLISRCIKKIDGSKMWESYDDMMSSSNIKIINELVDTFTVETQMVDSTQMRQLARYGAWRMRWNLGKSDISLLFGRSLADLSPNQQMLVYWSQVYDSAYESMDRPPQDVIEDDDMLDEWLSEQSEKSEREIGQRYYGKGTVKGKVQNSKIDNSPEVFKMVDGNYDDNGVFIPYSESERWENIEKIRNLNDPVTRKLKAKEEKELAKSPGVFRQENDLRKTKKHIEAFGGSVEIRKK